MTSRGRTSHRSKKGSSPSHKGEHGLLSAKKGMSPTKTRERDLTRPHQDGSVPLAHPSYRGKNCEREWVPSPVTGKWIEVNGNTWKALYPKYKKVLDAAKRETTLGRLVNGVCVVPVGDPPGHGGSRGGGGGSRGGGGFSRGGGGGFSRGGSSSRSGSFSRSFSGSPSRGRTIVSASPSRSFSRSPSPGFRGGFGGGFRRSYSPRRSYSRSPGRYRRYGSPYRYRRGFGFSPLISFGYAPYDPYWAGPPCYGDRWCWADYYESDYDDFYWL